MNPKKPIPNKKELCKLDPSVHHTPPPPQSDLLLGYWFFRVLVAKYTLGVHGTTPPPPSKRPKAHQGRGRASQSHLRSPGGRRRRATGRSGWKRTLGSKWRLAQWRPLGAAGVVFFRSAFFFGRFLFLLKKIGSGLISMGFHFGVGTTHFRTYFSGDWDVHWGYGILTHSHIWLRIFKWRASSQMVGGHTAPPK